LSAYASYPGEQPAGVQTLVIRMRRDDQARPFGAASLRVILRDRNTNLAQARAPGATTKDLLSSDRVRVMRRRPDPGLMGVKTKIPG
jgi:hypothetical protein